MRELIVSDAPLPRIAQLAKEVVEHQGGVVASHTHQATWFDHLRLDRDAWSRSGYLGTYQAFQGKQVRVRVRVWAAWPKRLFRFFVWFGLAQALVYFTMSLFQSPPPPNVWIWSAIVTFAGLAVTLLLYSSSWTSSAELEERLVRRLGAEIREDEEVEGDVYTPGGWKEHRSDLVEQAVAQAAPAQPKAEPADKGTGARLAKLRPRRKAKERAEGAEPRAKRRFSLKRRKEDESSATQGADQDAGEAPPVEDDEDTDDERSDETS